MGSELRGSSVLSGDVLFKLRVGTNVWVFALFVFATGTLGEVWLRLFIFVNIKMTFNLI